MILGDKRSRRKLNDVVRQIERSPIRPALRRKRILLGSSGGSGVSQFRYKSMGPDFIMAKTWDGTSEGDDYVKIAKPPLLRYTPFHGLTRFGIEYDYSSDHPRRFIEREATNDVETAGTLTTRTDDDTGVITFDDPHPFLLGDSVDVLFNAGADSRTGMDITAVTEFTISVDGGSGDNLPTEDDPVTVKPNTIITEQQVVIPYYVLDDIIYAVQSITGGIDIDEHSEDGSLFTRTDDDTGVIEMDDPNFAFVINETVDLEWSGGSRAGMIITAVTENETITVDGGSGDVLPATSTAITVTNRVPEWLDLNTDGRAWCEKTT